MNKEIESLDQDIWSVPYRNGVPYPIYNYFLDEPLFDADERLNTDVLGHCPALLSVHYTPFLNREDLAIMKIPYDNARFGSVDKMRPNISGGQAYVYRIMEHTNQFRKLATFETYPNKPNTVGKGQERHWQNESKLYQYPYSYALINDYFNKPMEVQYHLCNSYEPELWIKNTVSDRCTYGLFINGYKNDTEGKIEAHLSGGGNELPCSSSAYAQFYASNKNQIAQNISNTFQQSFLQTKHAKENAWIQGVMSLGNLASGNLMGAVGGVGGSYIGYQQQKESTRLDKRIAVQNSMAQQKDMMNVPNTMISQGSDIMYGLYNGDSKIDLFKMFIREEYAKKLGDYFAMYGYKVNKMWTVRPRDRYYYNYVKTVGVNLKSKRVPRSHLDKFKEILDNGVTMWHVDRVGVTVGDYSMDNYEIT